MLGFAPSVIGSRVNLADALNEGSRGSSAGSRGRSVLVVTEVAFSLLLLLGAGLLMKTFLQMQQADHGFEADNLLIANVRNNSFSKADRAERAALLASYHQRILDRLQSIPGVRSAAVTNSLPYAGNDLRNGRLRVQGRAEEETQFLLPVAGADVSWDYFQTMGIPLLTGRSFEPTDSSDGAPVVILNEVGAKALFGGENPIGRMVQWGDTVGPSNPYCRVVGMVADVKHSGVERDAIELYYPYTQWPVSGGYYVLRTGLDRAVAAESIRAVVRESDPNATIVWTKSMSERINEALWQRRLWGVLFTVFACLAMLLAAVGLYGLLSYGVSQRRRDIGILLALGAAPSSVPGDRCSPRHDDPRCGLGARSPAVGGRVEADCTSAGRRGCLRLVDLRGRSGGFGRGGLGGITLARDSGVAAGPGAHAEERLSIRTLLLIAALACAACHQTEAPPPPGGRRLIQHSLARCTLRRAALRISIRKSTISPYKTEFRRSVQLEDRYHGFSKEVFFTLAVDKKEVLRYAPPQCGAPAPHDFPTARVIRIPIRRFTTGNSSIFSAVTLLEIEDQLGGVPNRFSITGPKIRKLAMEREIPSIGGGTHANAAWHDVLAVLTGGQASTKLRAPDGAALLASTSAECIGIPARPEGHADPACRRSSATRSQTHSSWGSCSALGSGWPCWW